MCLDDAVLGSPIYSRFCNLEAAGNTEHEPFSTQIVTGLWEWRHEKGYMPFDAPLCDELEGAFQCGNPRCRVSAGGEHYDINFTHMWQQNCSTRCTRSIRRSFHKEAPVWYWCDKDGRHRLDVTAMILLEQEYQKLLAKQLNLPREVIWKIEGNGSYILNASTMLLTHEAGGQSYPITRTLIKADIPEDTYTELNWASIRDNVEQPAVPLKVPKVQPGGYNKEAKNSTFSTEKESNDPCRPRAEPSLCISVEGAGVNIQVPDGRSTTIHVAAPQQLLEQPLQRKSANQKTSSSVCSPGGPWAQTGGSVWCCSCKSTCCGSGRCAKAESSCPLRSCCCCCGCSGVSGSKAGCPSNGNVAAPECVQCNIPQQKGGSDAADDAVGNFPVDVAVGTDEGPSIPQVSSSTGSSTSYFNRENQESQPQTQLQGSPATLSEQQLLLQQRAMESQQSQFLDRQAEHLKRQVQLEQQQQELHQQQQQFIHQLQVQQAELAREQAEVREHQQQLKKQHEEQQLLTQPSEGMQLLGAGVTQNVDDAAPGREKRQLLPNGEESGTASNHEVLLGDAEPPTRRTSFEGSGNIATPQPYLSPVDEGHAAEDEYTCI